MNYNIILGTNIKYIHNIIKYILKIKFNPRILIIKFFEYSFSYKITICN